MITQYPRFARDAEIYLVKMFLHTVLQNAVHRSAEAEALVLTDNSSINYLELMRLVSKCALQLSKLDVESTARIGIYLPKHLLSAVAPFAISTLGAIFVPINPLLTSTQVKHIVDDAKLTVLITSFDRAKRLERELEKLHVTYLLSELSDGIDSLGAEYDVWDSDTASEEFPEWACEFELTAEKKLAALLYTSGSTGLPKGVMVSHENLTLGAESVNDYLGIEASDRILALLPFSFDYGLNQLVSSIVAGATCVLFDYLFAKDVLKAVSIHHITGIAGVPALWAQVVNADRSKQVFDTVRYITNSGGHMPEALLKKLTMMFPSAKPFLMYGLTEAFRSTYLPPSEIATKAESIGIPIPNAKILVVNESGGIAEPGEQGELVHAGPLVTMGYWNRPGETEKVYRPIPDSLRCVAGGLNSMAVWSGDTVRKDKDGFLYFVGRNDAMIKTSGYRVSPEEIEEVLYEVEQVQSVAAIGIPDESLGQSILVYVELTACTKQFDLEEIQEIQEILGKQCRENLPSYLMPKKIVLSDTLPKNPNGKIDRAELFRQYQLTL